MSLLKRSTSMLFPMRRKVSFRLPKDKSQSFDGIELAEEPSEEPFDDQQKEESQPIDAYNLAVQAGVSAQRARRRSSSSSGSLSDLKEFEHQEPKLYKLMLKSLRAEGGNCLNLSGTKITPQIGRAISQMLIAPQFDGKHCLKRLYLVDTKLDKDCLEEILKGLGSLPVQQLQVLVLSKNPALGDAACSLLREWLQKMGTVRTLVLNSCGITNHGAMMLSDCLMCNKSITELSLAANDILDDGAVALAEELQHKNRTLKSLNLAGNSISNGAIVALTTALKQNSVLQVLELSGSCMGGAVVSEESIEALKSAWAPRPLSNLCL